MKAFRQAVKTPYFSMSSESFSAVYEMQTATCRSAAGKLLYLINRLYL